MPYKSKSGETVPDCKPCGDDFPIFIAPRYVHGEFAKCPCFACCKCMCGCTPCKCDCTLCDKICTNCRGPCKPVCEICQKCDQICEIGPEIPCKAVGCELTLGVPALEKIFGTWHVAFDAFPMQLPAVLYPCICCLPAALTPPCPGGKDEVKNGDTFEVGAATETQRVKILSFLCKACSPYSALKQSIWGLAMDPIFGGDTPPFWYGTKFEPPKMVMSAKNFGSVHPEDVIEPLKM